MIRLTSIIKEILAEQTPAEQAKAMGLVHVGYGRWKNPSTNKIEYVTMGDPPKLVPYDSDQGSGEVSQQPSTNPATVHSAKSQEELDYLQFDRGGKWVNPYERIHDPDNSTYGPPPAGSPDIRSDYMNGQYENSPIMGIVRDIEVRSKSDGLRRLLPFDDGMGQGRLHTIYDNTIDTIYEKVTDSNEDFTPTLVDVFRNLTAWQVGENRSDAKQSFIEEVGKILPTRINPGGPLMRGLSIPEGEFDEFMSQFEIEATFSFPASYGFTTNSDIASRFTHSKDSPSNYPVVFRLHPSDDGLISAVSVNAVQQVRKEVSSKLSEEAERIKDNSERATMLQKASSDIMEGTDEILRNGRSVAEALDGLGAEREILTIPSTEYSVLGRTRMFTSRGEMIMIIDIQEKASQTTEQGLPARPTLPKPKAKSVNKVVHQYMDRPLNPNK